MLTSCRCVKVSGRGSGKGFTLLEVLIALAVLAISSLAIMGQSAQTLSQQQQFSPKITALLVAENHINALHVEKSWPPLGSRIEDLNVEGESWQLSIEVLDTTDPWLRKVVVRVLDQQFGKERVLAELISYRGRY